MNESKHVALEVNDRCPVHQQIPEVDRDVSSNPHRVRPENQLGRTSCTRMTTVGQSVLMVCS